MLATGNLRLPAGIRTAGSGAVSAEKTDAGFRLVGTLRRVPYGRDADHVVSVAGTRTGTRVIFVLSCAAAVITPGANFAGEPRDTITFDAEVSSDRSAEVPDTAAVELRLRGALSRVLLIAGAATSALRLTVRYGQERSQFGRPIAGFQAVQHQLAALAGEVSAARAAADSALEACAERGFESATTFFAVAAAKVRSAQAAGAVAAAAHQVHGAVGLSLEHELRLVTTRLWSWRSEWGGRRNWAQEVARAALDAGGPGLWPMLAAT
jgi:acyl-CoA dehydrogenase